MLLLLVLIVPVLSQDILGVYYSFEVDYYRTFNNKNCADVLPWLVKDYESIGIPKPSEKSTAAIVAAENSCVSSFPMILLPNSTLQFTIYMRTVTEYGGLIISIVDGVNDTAVATGYYNRSSDGFLPGWSILKLTIEVNGVYYINLKGRSRNDETVLIDSFQFKPNNAKIVEEVDQENVDEILNYVPTKYTKLSDELDEDEEGSADDEGSGENEEPVIDVETEPILGLWSIVLISVGAITVVALVGVGAYRCGKVKGLEASDVFDVNAEPPRVYNIPRVRGISNNSMVDI